MVMLHLHQPSKAASRVNPLPQVLHNSCGSGFTREGASKPGSDQHSITLTARPPREVSLYLSCMSAPVSRMVRIT